MRKPMNALLTAIGKNPKKTKYCHKGKAVETEFAPLALVQLLDKSFAKLYILVTEGVKSDEWPRLQGKMKTLLPEVRVVPIEIPDGRTKSELSEILRCVAQNLKTNGMVLNLTLDITHGLRHFPFLFHALVIYLSGLRGIRISGVYYGALEMAGDEKPFVDLKPLVELPEWSYAVRMFRETGATGPIAELVRNQEDIWRHEAKASGESKDLHKIATQFGKISKGLYEFTKSYESALPLELGRAVNGLFKQLGTPPDEVIASIPLAKELIGILSESIEHLASSELQKTTECVKGDWKAKVVLTQFELQREAFLIDQYLKRSQNALAIGLMREWLVSLVSLHLNQQHIWLERHARIRAEQKLGGLGAYIRNRSKLGLPETIKEQKRWGEFWNRLSESRNYFHHHGMKQQQDIVDMEKIKKDWEYWKSNLPKPPQLGGGRGRLLICPFGLSPGVLYSALWHVRPDLCLLLSSSDSAMQADEAAARSGWVGTPVIAMVQDPYKGFAEYEKIQKNSAEMLFVADEVLVSLTGGTTLMGIFAQQLSEHARKFQRPVKRFVLIDPRPPDTQRKDPYHCAEIYWLDKGDHELEE
jgi:CRISPR-associated DxTHG motif protein